MEDNIRLQAKDKKERYASRKIESEVVSHKAREFVQMLYAAKQRSADKTIKVTHLPQNITALPSPGKTSLSDLQGLTRVVQSYSRTWLGQCTAVEICYMCQIGCAERPMGAIRPSPQQKEDKSA